jgi:predicted nucleotidyltransferase
MKVVGLITEYNPFHYGHKYHLDKAKKITGSDFVIVVMSGNFVQRGTPAITDKYTRTKMALSQGADLVLELPVYFATGSAEYFAYGAISILNSLGIVDSICFGSESGNIEVLSSIADLLVEEPPLLENIVSDQMKKGISYPLARMNAITTFLDQPKDSLLTNVLSSSNNILGIEYLKALKRLNSSITPYTIQRKDSNYNDLTLHSNKINSATAIRRSYFKEKNMDFINKNIPPEITDILTNAKDHTFPIHEDDFSELLYYKICETSKDDLEQYLDISSDLSKRIKNNLIHYTNFTDFSLLLKTKQYTLTRINRGLLHILLGIKKQPSTFQPPYIRILGLRKEASFLLNKKSNKNLVPIITKIADSKNLLSEKEFATLSQDIFAANIYNRTIYTKFGIRMPNEYQNGIIIV